MDAKTGLVAVVAAAVISVVALPAGAVPTAGGNLKSVAQERGAEQAHYYYRRYHRYYRPYFYGGYRYRHHRYWRHW